MDLRSELSRMFDEAIIEANSIATLSESEIKQVDNIKKEWIDKTIEQASELDGQFMIDQLFVYKQYFIAMVLNDKKSMVDAAFAIQKRYEGWKV